MRAHDDDTDTTQAEHARQVHDHVTEAAIWAFMTLAWLGYTINGVTMRVALGDTIACALVTLALLGICVFYARKAWLVARIGRTEVEQHAPRVEHNAAPVEQKRAARPFVVARKRATVEQERSRR